jgi:hypothetical protein
MADIREIKAQRIEDDHAGTFDVIKFLKDLRVSEAQANI